MQSYNDRVDAKDRSSIAPVEGVRTGEEAVTPPVVTGEFKDSSYADTQCRLESSQTARSAV